jgi:hypothetical protein
MRGAAAAARVLAVAAAVSGCGAGAGGREASDVGDEVLLTIRFEDVEIPEILEMEALARPAAAEAGAGLWAAVPGLVRPERGRVGRADGEGAVVVALYRAAPGEGLSVSAEAAEVLGIAAPAVVRVVAVRTVPRLGGRGLGPP